MTHEIQRAGSEKHKRQIMHCSGLDTIIIERNKLKNHKICWMWPLCYEEACFSTELKYLPAIEVVDISNLVLQTSFCSRKQMKAYKVWRNTTFSLVVGSVISVPRCSTMIIVYFSPGWLAFDLILWINLATSISFYCTSQCEHYSLYFTLTTLKDLLKCH